MDCNTLPSLYVAAMRQHVYHALEAKEALCTFL